MMNQIVLVGRITKEITMENNTAIINIAVPRPYKNENGEYDTDFINITSFDVIAEKTKNYWKKGDIIGVKGRIKSSNNKIEIIAERITFLSSKKSE